MTKIRIGGKTLSQSLITAEKKNIAIETFIGFF